MLHLGIQSDRQSASAVIIKNKTVAGWRCALVAGVRVGRRHDALHHAEPLVQDLPSSAVCRFVFSSYRNAVKILAGFRVVKVPVGSQISRNLVPNP